MNPELLAIIREFTEGYINHKQQLALANAIEKRCQLL